MHVEQKLTPEEMAARKSDMIKQMEQDTPYLKAQLEYQKLLTEIEELRMRQARAIQAITSIMAPPPKEDEPQPKKLKKDGVTT